MICPYCQSEDVELDEVRVHERGTVWTCLDCSRRFDVYFYPNTFIEHEGLQLIKPGAVERVQLRLL